MELDTEQAACLGQMLSSHPSLGDAVLGQLTDATHAEAAQEIAAAAEREAHVQDVRRPHRGDDG